MTDNRNTPTVEQISAAVEARREEIIALLGEVVRIPSENPKLTDTSPNGEINVQAWMSGQLRELDAKTDQWEPLPNRPNLVGTIAGSGGGRSLALNTHIDTVAVGDHANWTHAPFGAEIVDGRMYGRGAVDPKGGLAAMLGVALVLRDLNITLAGDLLLEAVIDEETGGPGSAATVERGYKPDFALVLDGASPIHTITAIEGGLEWLRLTVRGVGGHSAWRYRSVHAGGQGHAVSAFDKAMKIVAAVAELERMWANRKYSPWLPAGITTINVGVFAAGGGGGQDGKPNVWTNVSSLPDYCAMDLSLKYLESETPEQVKAEFEEYIHNVCQLDPWLKENPPTIEWGLHGVSFPPAFTDPEHPGIQELSASSKAFGLTPTVGGFAGVSDIAWFAQAGVPVVICGPGQGGNAHGADEWIDLDSLIECVKVTTHFAINWCGLS